MAQKELQYATNSEGERIIPGSRRADGSLRPERRIREGYVPQEERPLYQSRAALERRGVTVCPGADFVDEQESKPATSKSAKKRRNKKKNTSVPTGEDKAIHEMESLAIDESKQTEGVADKTSLSAEEKQLRALRKKIRECEALQQRQDAGETLTSAQEEKLSKLESLKDELAKLEEC